MLKPTPNVLGADFFDRSFQCPLESMLGPRPAPSQISLDFGDALFKRIKVWRISRQIFHTRPGRLDQANRPQAAVEGDLIEHYDVVDLLHQRSSGAILWDMFSYPMMSMT